MFNAKRTEQFQEFFFRFGINQTQQQSFYNLFTDVQKLNAGSSLDSVQGDLQTNINALMNSNIPPGVKQTLQMMMNDVTNPQTEMSGEAGPLLKTDLLTVTHQFDQGTQVQLYQNGKKTLEIVRFFSR